MRTTYPLKQLHAVTWAIVMVAFLGGPAGTAMAKPSATGTLRVDRARPMDTVRIRPKPASRKRPRRLKVSPRTTRVHLKMGPYRPGRRSPKPVKPVTRSSASAASLLVAGVEVGGVFAGGGVAQGTTFGLQLTALGSEGGPGDPLRMGGYLRVLQTPDVDQVSTAAGLAFANELLHFEAGALAQFGAGLTDGLGAGPRLAAEVSMGLGFSDSLMLISRLTRFNDGERLQTVSVRLNLPVGP